MRVRYGVLGETWAVRADGTDVPLGGPGRRALLALLLLEAGHPVAVPRLVDGLYGEHPPAGAVNAVQAQVSRLRAALREPIESHPAGYRLAVDPAEVDAHRFERLAAHGREALRAGVPEEAAAALREALALWRGPVALADVGPAPFAASRATRLAELRLSAVEDRISADLALGADPGPLVAELGALLPDHPLRERLHAHLVRALRAAGRPSEALAAYEAARRTLAEELGADPGPELTRLHLALLRGEGGGESGGRGGGRGGADASAGTAGGDVSRETGARRETGHVSRETSPGVSLSAGASAPSSAAVPAVGRPVSAGVAGPRTPATSPYASAPAWASPAGAVPAPVGTFVGREDELARIAELLSGRRLVTLLGPGGAGKTRLAVEAAGRLDGEACFVDLSGLGPGADADVVTAVLAALGLRESGLRAAQAGSPGPDPLERVAAALADRPLLLVLDNCEHVVAGAAVLADRLLGACPVLRVLATTREALGVSGETLCPVGPLALPPPDADPGSTADAADTAGTAGQAEWAAVRLFTDRAAAVRPDLLDGGRLRADLLPDAVRICRALDGLPLAIELAAARLRSLSPADIAARLAADQRFRLLTRGSRTAQPRQQTLRGVVDWSWDLLSAPERALLRRVSVFAGSWTLGAAEEVCAAGEPGGAESLGGAGTDPGADLVLDLTDSLVEKSLVVAQHTPGGTRYRLLDTIRAYAAERLAEAGEAERLRVAHTEWALRLLRTADPWLRRAGQLEWLARLTAEHDNLHAALHRAVAAGDTAAGLRLVAALSTYWLLRGMRHEGAGPAARLLAATGTEPPEELRDEYALTVLAALVPLDDTAPLAAHVALTREIVESGGRISARYPTLSLLWAPVAGAPEAEVDIPALTADFIAAKGEDRWYRALVRLGTGFQHWLVRADPVAAGAECGRALADFRALGERWGMMTTLTALASIAESLGDLDRARAHVDEALTLAGELGATVDIAEFLCQRAGFLARAGQYAAADADHERAMALFRRAGAPEGLAAARAGLAATAWLRGDLPAARRRYEQALAECPSGWFAADSVRSLVLAGLGRVAVARGDAPGARRALADALAVLRGARDLPGTAASAAEGLAGLAFLDGDAERTAELLGITSALRGAPAPPAAGPGNARVAGAAGVSGAGGSAEVAETGPGNASAHGSARAAADPGAVDQAAGAKAGAADRPTGTGAADSGTVDGASDADTDTASRAATDDADRADEADASAAERAEADDPRADSDAGDPRHADADARNLPRAARPPYPADAASLAAAARAVLGADAYAAAFERGARRSLDDALALLGAELAH